MNGDYKELSAKVFSTFGIYGFKFSIKSRPVSLTGHNSIGINSEMKSTKHSGVPFDLNLNINCVGKNKRTSDFFA